MNLNESNEFYPNDLLYQQSKENKTVFFLGDFNINPLNYDQDRLTNELFDSQSSYLFLSYILQPTTVRGKSKTLMDNIFLNAISHNIMYGNLTPSISNHFPQFLISPSIFLTPHAQNLTYMKKTGLKLTRETLPWTIFQLIGIRYYL